MNLQVLFICGIIAGVLSVFAYLPYIIDTLKGQARPQRSGWMIWSALSSISFFAQVAEGATDSLWFQAVQTGGTVVVFLLSIRFGSGCFFNRFDSVIILCAAAGLYLWYSTESAVYALMISIVIGALGGVLTVVKAYRDPDSESMRAWMISLIATFFALISVGKLDWVILAYPFYLFVLYISIVVAMMLGRTAKASHTNKGRRGRARARQTDQLIPTVQQPVIYRKLAGNATTQGGMMSGLEKLNDDKITALVFNLKKRGVGEHVISDALYDVVHG